MPNEAFDISIGDTLAKVIECFESEYYENDDVEFFAPAWELDVENEEPTEVKEVVAVEKEDFEKEHETNGNLSYANIAKKNVRARSNGFDATDSKMNRELFPPLVSDGEPTREWNEPPLEEDFAPRPARRRETDFPTESFGTAVADATQILEMVAIRVVTSILRHSFRIFRTKNVTFTRYSVTSRVLRRSFSKVSARVKTLAKRASFYARNLAPSSVETTTVNALER